MIFAVSKLYYLKNIFFSDCLPYFKTPLGCSRAPVCFLLLSITLASVTTPELIRALLYMSISETGHPAGWRINTHTHTHTHTHHSHTHTSHTHTLSFTSAGFWLAGMLEDLRILPFILKWGIIFCCSQPPQGRVESLMFAALNEEACFHQYANSHSSPFPGKQINLITKGHAKKRRWGRRKSWGGIEAKSKTPNRRKNGYFFQKQTTSGCIINHSLLDYLTLSSLQGSHPN